MTHIIIIGSGLAGYNTAREIRQLDKNIKLTMITSDGGAFYSKPQLSTSLSNNKTAESLMAMSAEMMSKKLDMTIMPNSKVEAINKETDTITVNGETYHYDSLILALGADTPQPPVTGDAIDCIHYINDVYQYQRFRDTLKESDHITVIGAGLVGCEFANDLSHSKHQVTCIDLTSRALSQLVPEEISQPLQQALEAQGVTWKLGSVVKSVVCHQDKTQVTLDNGESFITDIVISAIGLKPKVSLAKESHLKVNRGIVVDRYLRTSQANIYALGDCAEINGWTLPYIAPIMQAAKAIAKTVTGIETPMAFPAMPVVVKTTCYPIVICCPPGITDAHWQFETDDSGTTRGYLRQNDTLIGFILTKDAIKERMSLLNGMKAWV